DRCVHDAILSKVLIHDQTRTDCFVLSGDEDVSRELFNRMRVANELDRLFVGQYHLGWGTRLFGSGYGKAHVTASVLPAVNQSYSVDLTTHPCAPPIRTVLQTSPTAAQLVIENRPSPSNLVRIALLELAAFTGASFDAFAAPEVLLESELRHAYESLA